MEAWSLQPAYSYCQWSFMSRRKDFDSLRRAASRFLYCSTMKSQGRFCILCHFYCLCTLRLLVLFPQLELVLPSSSTLALPVSLNRCTPSFTQLHCSFLLKFSGIRDHGHTSWDSSLCEVTGIWSRKASLGNPSTARWAKGVCYITLHWSHSRTVFCTVCCQQTSGVSALCFCLYSEILKSSGSDPCALLAPTYRGRWAPSISVPNETRSSWKCGVFGERGSAVPRAIYVSGLQRERELTATGLQRAAPISRCLPSALHPAGRTQRASPGAAGGPRPGPERRSRPLSAVSSLPPQGGTPRAGPAILR